MVVDVAVEVDSVEGVEGVEEFGLVNGADFLLKDSDQMQPLSLPVLKHLLRSEQMAHASMILFLKGLFFLYFLQI